MPKSFIHPQALAEAQRAINALAMASGGFVGKKYFGKKSNLNQEIRSYGKKKGYKKRYRKRKRKTVNAKDYQLRKQVKSLKRIAESDMGTHIHRIRLASSAGTPAVNTTSLSDWASVNITNIEAAIAELRYYNPSVPATLTNASGASGSFQKEFYFKRVYSRLRIRNNYQAPCNVIVYPCVPREDTSINPSTTVTNGLTDIGAPTAASDLVYPTDSIQFNDLWRIDKSQRAYLDPGQEMVVSHAGKPFQYDPSLSDSHGLTFQNRFSALSFLLRIVGCISHDSTDTSEVGLAIARVDVFLDTTFEIHYAAGADIKFITISDGVSTFTNGPLCSNKPVSDNQTYSVA